MPDAPDFSRMAAASPIDAAMRRRIRSYFEKKYDTERMRHRALHLIAWLRKLALGIIGGVVLVAALAAAVAGRLGHEWLQGLEAYELIAGGVAILFVALALLIRTVEHLPDREQVEREVDAAKDYDISSLLQTASKLAAGAGGPPVDFDMKLVGYADKNAAQDLGLLVAAQAGLDGKLRFTPAMVTAVTFGEHSATFYEATVDLTAGNMAAERLFEAPYREITMIERSSLSPPLVPERAPKSNLGQALRRRSERLRDKDVLLVHFSNHASVKIVLRDTTYADAPRSAGFPLSEPHEKIEAFWQTLRAKWLAAISA